MKSVVRWSAGSWILIAAIPAVAQGTAASAPATGTSSPMPNSTPAVDPTWLVAGTIIGLAVGLSAGYALGKLSGLSMFVNRVVTKEMAR